MLERLAETRGLTKTIVVDNSPAFQSRALDAWAHARAVSLQFIRPGKPVDNCLTGAFNSRLRYECLNQHFFLTLSDARVTIELAGQLTTRRGPSRPPAPCRLTIRRADQQDKLTRVSAQE